MNTQDLQLILITAAAIAATLTVVLYGLLQPWYRSAFGWAFIVDGVSFATLLDLALLAHWFHWIIPADIATGLYVFIAVGCWLQLGALVGAIARGDRAKRG